MARSMKNVVAEAQNDTTNTATQSVDWGKCRFMASRSIQKRLQAQGLRYALVTDDGVIVQNLKARDLSALGNTIGITSARYKDHEEGSMSAEDFSAKTDEAVRYLLADDNDCSSAL